MGYDLHPTALTHDEIKDRAIKNEDGQYELRYFVANSQVDLNFWLRA